MNKCIECKKKTIAIKKAKLCKTCYSRLAVRKYLSKLKADPIAYANYLITKKTWVHNHLEYYRSIGKAKRLRENKIKRKSHAAVLWRIKTGKMKRRTQCEICKSESRVEAHHDDYNKPLSVRYLCKKCHMKAHNFTTIEPMGQKPTQ